MEASLEDWEDLDQSLQLLRLKVCAEVGVSEDMPAWELQRKRLEEENRQIEAVIIELRKKWLNLKELHSNISEIEKGFDPLRF
jgi:hypothetical protein